MLKAAGISVILIIVLWIINIIISGPTRKELGIQDEIFRKMVSNGNGLFYSLLGVGIVLIAFYRYSFLRWPILIFVVLYLLWEVVTFLIASIGTIIFVLRTKESQKHEFLCMISNIIGASGNAIILFLTIKYLF